MIPMKGLLRTYAVMTLALIVALSSVPHAQARHAAHGAQTMVICTGYGLVRITLDANGNPVEQSLPCPDCVLTLAAMLVEPAALPILHAASEVKYRQKTALWSGAAAGLWAESRGPPLPV